MAQEGQSSTTAPPQAPDDQLGLAPKAKVVASWPRVSLLRKAAASPTAIPARAAQAPAGAPRTFDAGGIQAEAIANRRPNPFNRFFKSTPFPRPGQAITLSGLESSDTDGSIVAYKWRAQYMAEGSLNVVASEQPVFTVTTAADTTQVDATLTVTDNDGRQSQAAISVRVVPNTPPKVELSRLRQVMQCQTTRTIAAPQGTPSFKFVNAAPTSNALANAIRSLPAVGGRPVTVYANGCDADGAVVSYRYRKLGPGLPDDGTIAGVTSGADWWQPLVTRGAAPEGWLGASDETRKSVEFEVTAVDDEGATATALLKLGVITPCDPVDQFAGQLGVRPLTACVEGKKTDPQTKVETIPIGSDGGSFLVRGVEITVAPRSSGQTAGNISWNPKDRVGLIDVEAGAVTAVARSGARLDLPAGRLLWKIDGVTGRVVDDGGFKWEGGTLGGLKLASLENFELAPAQFGKSPLFGFQADLVAEAPGEFNPVNGSSGQTAQQPVHFEADMRTQAGASATGRAAQAAFKLGPQDMEIGGVSMKNAYMSFNGDDTWEVAGDFRLDSPIPIPQELSAGAGIQNGGLWYLDVETDFPGSGIQVPGTGVNIDGLRFTLDFGKGIETTCVPRIGVKKLDFAPVRQSFALFGYGGGDPNSKAIYDTFPDYTLDYGKPEFQACGQVTFNTITKILGKTLAEGTLAVGLADYSDYSVFRIVGKPMKLIGIPSELLFELYSDKYIHLNAGAKTTFAGGKVSASAEFDFAARFPKFNAQAGAEVCVHVWDIGCASATGLMSNRGFGACYELDVLMFEFSPGALVSFDKGFTPFLDGCDIGDVKVGVKSSGGPTSEKIPWPGGGTAQAAQVRTGATFNKDETAVLNVAPGSTGAVFAVQGALGGPQGPLSRLGAANNLPRFRLVAPNGVAIEVDDQPSPNRVLRPIDMQHPSAPKYRVLRAPAEGVTNVIVPRAQAGDWKITILSDRPAKVRLSEGVPKPQAAGRLQRAGAERVLSNLRFKDKREGMVARLFDRGASGVQQIGQYPLTAGDTTRVPSLRFQPAARRSEPRLLEVYFERNGFPVGYQRLGSYQASAPPPPPAPGGIKIRQTARSLTARWDKVPDAASYQVLVTTNDGRRMAFTTRANGIKESMPFQRYDSVNVQVRAVSRLGRAGRVGGDRVAARGSKPTVRFTPAQRRALARMARG